MKEKHVSLTEGRHMNWRKEKEWSEREVTRLWWGRGRELRLERVGGWGRSACEELAHERRGREGGREGGAI